MGAKGSKHLTKSEFNNIKLLQQAGLKQAQASKVTNRSSSIVNNIYAHDTFELMRTEQAAQRQISRRTASTKLVEVAPPQAQPHEDFGLVLQKLSNLEAAMNSLLEIFRDKEAKANVSFWKR